MIRTRVGYTGGTTPSPSYRDLGDHSEGIQIDYDPAVISYEELLELALRAGDFQGLEWSHQYRSAVFYHNEAQAQAAKQKGISKSEPFGQFTRAEDYHQKYYLQQSRLAKEFYARYPAAQDFTDSSAVTKANGIVGGHIDLERLKVLVPELGLSEQSAQMMYEMAGEAKPGCAAP